MKPEALRDALTTTTSGAHLAALTSASAERAIHDVVARTIPAGMPAGVCLVAQGGLARRQWLPGADVDLLLLGASAERVSLVDVGPMLAALWDEGYRPALATRAEDELLGLFDLFEGKDGHAAMALMEARPLAGDLQWGRGALRALRRGLGAPRRRRLLRARLDEALIRRARAHFSASLVEPDPKDGVGGLRCAQLASWVGLCVSGVDVGDDDALSALLQSGTLQPSEVAALRAASDTLLFVRAALAASSNDAPERRLHAAAAERAAALVGLVDEPGLRASEALVRTATTAMRACAVACDDVIVRLVGKDAPAAFHARPPLSELPTLGALLAQQEPSTVPGPMTALLERGALGDVLVDIARLRGRVKHDGIHAFCTDAHLARCGDIALAIVGGTPASALGELALPTVLLPVLRRVERPAVVVAGALLHDIGKGLPGDHSIVGEEIARRELPKLGLSDEEVNEVCVIVRHHLALSNAAQRSDLGDPKVIDQLAAVVEGPALLDALAIVTWCDWCAVGPGVGTAWKGRLLADCVEAVREALLSPHLVAKDEAAVRARAKAALSSTVTGATREAIGAFVDGASVPWLRGRTAHALRDDATAFAMMAGRAPAVVIDSGAPQRAWIYCADRPGLLADLAAAFAAEGASVLDARLDVRADGRAFDCFVFDDGRAGLVSAEACRLLEHSLRDATAGRVRTPTRRPPRVSVPVRVRFLDDDAAGRIVVEVRGADRRGLLHDLARVFGEQGLTITLARLHTEGARVTDVFTARSASDAIVDAATRARLAGSLRDAMLPG